MNDIWWCMHYKRWYGFIVLVLAVQLVGCGGGNSGGNNDASLSADAGDTSSAVEDSTSGADSGGSSNQDNGGSSSADTGSSNGSSNQVTASGVTLTWTAPVAREDETPLSLAEIGGYRVYYGAKEGEYPNRIDVQDGSAVRAMLSDVPPGTYYIVVTTYDTAGRESEYSNVVVKTL